MNRLRVAFLPILCALFFSISGAADWHQFRGPTGRGHAETMNVPASWDESSIAWKVSLKGSGQSSPVTSGDRIFLTGASDDGTERYIQCLSYTTGKILWEASVPCESPEAIHAMNSRATPSCVTDGKMVVAFFGPGGLHGFTVEGEKKWSRNLGDFPGGWGIAASPVLLDGKVIQNCDSMGESSLLAVEIETGETVWQTLRESKPRGGWSTPILIEFDGRRELVLNGEFGVRGYNPATGKELWFCEGFNGRGSPVPEFDGKLLYVVNGKPGDTYCVKPGGSGNVSATHRVWSAGRKGGRDLPSPAVVDQFLFISSMSGIATCYDTRTGDAYFSERLGEGIQIAAAPLVVNDLIYLQTVQGGDVIVIRPGKELEIVSVNSLGKEAAGETFRATLTPRQGGLLIRSGKTLYAIKK